MATLSPDVRNSTLRSLKLTCPSAEVVHDDVSSESSISPVMGHTNPNPFGDADAEWSDEEELLARSRRKTQYIPPHVKITATSAETSSEASTESSPSRGRLSRNHGPPVPPKSPSRPDVRPGSSQDDLVQRFYQVTRERDALRKELQRKSVGPHGIPATASVVYKSEEKTLIEELHALRYEIRIWTEEYFSGPIKTSSRRPYLTRAKKLFGNLSENYNTYLKDHDDRPLLMQSYIWSQLQTKIFSNWQKGCGYVWAGKLGDRKLRPINDTLRKAVKNEEEAEQYHQWRSLTVNLLVPQVDGKWRPTFDASPVLKRISRFCSRTRRKLRPWSAHSLRAGKEQLHTIVSAAVALDLKMKRQLADYRFVTFTGGKKDQFWGYGFYESEMEDVYDDDEDEYHAMGGYGSMASAKSRKVELALAPALERCGNSNGHIFEQSFMLVKADVSCKRLEKMKKPVRPTKKGGGMRGGVEALGKAWNRQA
ncbi:hypothetical protein HBI56_115070 [Parastagonospora nodorum]|uniref:Uncharacterized protein n=1 Tax=Phaeosphaeria nodorum (strain SN15 / ATCC MYA-4574 / FGSC 10173) TaxID=321614 RepID=A0A7U2I3M7_PHANO|nr:hypothetical protein HBH56_195920 [Parastagonospora nodorum]QRD00575.1 hypothetical protein JI435_091310 [Parastagonospora nodorum SN15]KAH3924883.1 hypothetical protein HBH54_187570 [Parastagonospora nodorum]KAH3953311.1 hypothetical protein HBH53_039710 [Parastagonospora nodorum]KAH3976256.1 hypothetical protein HBH52_118780 [Parastagonospora nodorum]